VTLRGWTRNDNQVAYVARPPGRDGKRLRVRGLPERDSFDRSRTDGGDPFRFIRTASQQSHVQPSVPGEAKQAGSSLDLALYAR
jgi:hypothetical protein